jgi:excisionase family DNA binding protein
MARSARDFNRPVLPTPAAVAFAGSLLYQLKDDGARFVLQDRESQQTLEIDETVYELLRQLLINLAMNRPVSIIPCDHELTTYQAADLLNVSRGYVLKLIENKELRHRMVGTHRRIRLEDLLDYRDKMRAESDKAMDELAEASQVLGLE